MLSRASGLSPLLLPNDSIIAYCWLSRYTGDSAICRFSQIRCFNGSGDSWLFRRLKYSYNFPPEQKTILCSEKCRYCWARRLKPSLMRFTMTFTISFTLSFTIYGLPASNSILSLRNHSCPGGRGSPLSGYGKMLFLITVTMRKT